MTVLMDGAVNMLAPRARAAYQNDTLADVGYADDTLLLGVSSEHLSEYLNAVSAAGKRYGLILHNGKLQLLNVRCQTDIKTPED